MPSRLISRVALDAVTVEVAKAFDVPFSGDSGFTPHEKPNILPGFNLGVIVGGSGTGKSVLLREFGEYQPPLWDPGRSVASHFESANEAMLKLSAAGLSSIPDWVKPYQVLSTGQRFRADLARSLASNTVIDEFTSTVDRQVAKAASVAVARYIRKQGMLHVVLATCHRDILEWLAPDWVFDTDVGQLVPARFLQPKIEAMLVEGGRSLWPMFAPHHYMSGTLANSSRCFTLLMEDAPVGFYAVMPMPGKIKDAWRGHRSVILPEYQGLGLGGRMAEAVGDIMLSMGRRFFCRTAHPWVGLHRDNSPLWRATSTSQKLRTLWKNRPTPRIWMLDVNRVCYSHEYLGTGDRVMSIPKTPTKNKVRKPHRMFDGDVGLQVSREIMSLPQERRAKKVKELMEKFHTRRSSIYRLLKYHGENIKA